MATAKNRDQLVPRARMARDLPSGPDATASTFEIRNTNLDKRSRKATKKNNEVDDGDANSLRRSLCWAMDGLR